MNGQRPERARDSLGTVDHLVGPAQASRLHKIQSPHSRTVGGDSFDVLEAFGEVLCGDVSSMPAVTLEALGVASRSVLAGTPEVGVEGVGGERALCLSERSDRVSQPVVLHLTPW